MGRRMKRIALLLALALAAAPALAQRYPGKGGPPGPARMDAEERQRLREDLNAARRDVYREPPGQRRFERRAPGRMSDAEREQLRRDVLDANRDLQRR